MPASQSPSAPAALQRAAAASAPASRVLFAAPHRVMFFAGTLQLVIVLAFWSAELAGRYTGLWSPLATTVPTTWAHSFLMIYGVYPFFIFGFLMTTFPRWLNTPPIARKRYVAVFTLLSAGMILFYAGLFLSRPALQAGMIVFVGGWLTGLSTLTEVYLNPGKPRAVYETLLGAALILGFLGATSGLVWLITRQDGSYRFMLTGGLWLFLAPVLVIVSHRMIPFFGSAVLKNYEIRRPAWSLPLLCACLVLHAVLEVAREFQWLFVPDLILAAAAFRLSITWEARRSFRVPLLAMLHVAFLWFGVAMLLYGVQSLVLFLDGRIILGKAPVHALGIGFVTSMLLAMASRVTLGHSGRPLAATRMTLACFILLQFAALFRIFGELPAFVPGGANHWNQAAALLWLMLVLAWSWHYLPVYFKPRIDGRPG